MTRVFWWWYIDLLDTMEQFFLSILENECRYRTPVSFLGRVVGLNENALASSSMIGDIAGGQNRSMALVGIIKG